LSFLTIALNQGNVTQFYREIISEKNGLFKNDNLYSIVPACQELTFFEKGQVYCLPAVGVEKYRIRATR
jgi:hypothetical protein